MNAITKPASKSSLRAKAPKAAEPTRPKILLFGPEGIGKTWFSLQFPSVYFIDVERGASRAHYTDLLEASGGVYMGPEEGAGDFEIVLDQLRALATETHSYKTVVIDSVTKLFNNAIADEEERLGDKDAFGASKKPATRYMRRLVNWLTRMDLSVVLIAHQKDKWGLNDKGVREVVGVMADCWEKLPYELDLTINLQKQGARRIGKVGKSRLIGFPELSTFDFNFPEFSERWGKDVIGAEAQPLKLAGADQVAEIHRLLAVVKLPEGQADKWLNAAGAEGWADMDAEKAEKIIGALNAKLTA